MDCCDVARILPMLLGLLVVGFCMYTAFVANAAIADPQYSVKLPAHFTATQVQHDISAMPVIMSESYALCNTLLTCRSKLKLSYVLCVCMGMYSELYSYSL
jgi:hypothetical protein